MDIVNLPDDMTVEEKQLLREYKKNGCPGLVRINVDKVSGWFNLYMAGKTYTEIAKISHQKKDIILYVAEKGKWNEKKIERYTEIAHNLLEKTRATVLESASNVADMVSAYNKYYNKKMNKYHATNDDTILESLDTKMLAEYRKTVESLEKLISSHCPKSSTLPTDSEPKSSVNININTPVTVEEQDQSIDIAQVKTPGDMLKTLLKLKNKK